MNKKDIKTVIDAIVTNVSQAIRNSSADIIKAYETLHDEGGLPISIGVKLQGNMDTIKTIYNISFPKDKVKCTYKVTIDVKQGLLFSTTGEDSDEADPSGEEQETRPLAGDAAEEPEPPDPDPPADELPAPTHNIKAGKDISIKVGEFQDGPVWKWFAEINFPDGGQDYDGAYDSQETFKTRDAAGQAGLAFAIGQLDLAINKNVFAPSAKARVNKGRGLMVAELGHEPEAA